MQELDPTWRRTLSVWWLVMWRGLLGGTAIGFAIGFVVGAIRMALGIPQLSQAVPILGAITAGLWFLLVVRMALRKRYKGFRIALVPIAHSNDFGTASATQAEPRS